MGPRDNKIDYASINTALANFKRFVDNLMRADNLDRDLRVKLHDARRILIMVLRVGK